METGEDGVVGGVEDASLGVLGLQPSYPFLVLHILTSASPESKREVVDLAIEAELPVELLRVDTLDSPNSSEHPVPCSSGLSMIRDNFSLITLKSVGLEITGLGEGGTSSCRVFFAAAFLPAFFVKPADANCRFARWIFPLNVLSSIESRAPAIFAVVGFFTLGIGFGDSPPDEA